MNSTKILLLIQYDMMTAYHHWSACSELFMLVGAQHLVVFFFLVPLTPICSDLASPFVPDLVCCTSCNNILFTSSASFSRSSLYSTFDVTAKIGSIQCNVLTNLIIFSYQTAVYIHIYIYIFFLRKRLIEIKILANHYDSWLI